MVGGNVNISLFDFQEKAVLSLIDLTTGAHKQTITVKSPTGSGKTIILINYIDEYLSKIDSNTAFVWLCPKRRSGGTEPQENAEICTDEKCSDADGRLEYRFTAESTTFINWELVTKTGNRAISEGERKNLFDRIAEAHRSGVKFIIIVDEEHSNNTARHSDYRCNCCEAHYPHERYNHSKQPLQYMEIDELEVINAQLITKAIYVNEGIVAGEEITNDYDNLLELADTKKSDRGTLCRKRQSSASSSTDQFRMDSRKPSKLSNKNSKRWDIPTITVW